MRKIVYYVATTLDGFIARPDGSTDGFLPDGPHVQAYLDSLSEFDTVLMGRKTYEFGYQFGLQPGRPAYEAQNLKNFVFGNLKFDSGERIEFIRSGAIEVIRDLKDQPGQNIYLCGGGDFAGVNLQAGLIDQLKIKLNPVLFGQGISLFGGHTENPRLRLVDQQAFDNGVFFLTYDLVY